MGHNQQNQKNQQRRSTSGLCTLCLVTSIGLVLSACSSSSVGDQDLSIKSFLSSDKFQTIINNCRDFRSRLYTPFVTLVLFIRQVLSPDKSC
ncbi:MULTISPECIES: hypothetical protein, partial [Cysteiniphilum]|uniref:hypothetical protein n=1 Tax=Cysteiniphilum TaxID=2056696 RepID=UPI00177DD21C